MVIFMIKTAPAVFAVGKNYQIMVPVSKPSLMWVKIGDKCYYDELNGIMRSITTVHRITVPMEVLDSAKSYTVCEKILIERKPYFPTSKPTTEKTYKFRPVTKRTGIRAFHIADAHNYVEGPVNSAKAYGKMDFLIMNGDIPDHSGSIKNFDTIYKIAAKVTKGRIPIVFSRGNHDLRGFFAEKIAEYTPSENLNTYYTFRLGSIWGIVLDCGEDKDDSHEEYGQTVACHQFREKQTEFIKEVIKNKSNEYAESGVKTRLVISHNPFTYLQNPPFDIERETFGEWAKLLKDNIKPDLMICGHIHGVFIKYEGEDFDHLGQPCPLVIGSDIKDNYFVGAGFEFSKNNIKVDILDSCGKNLLTENIKKQ
ncbi:MAG: metallophosphoesterase [Clostridia bacterium]|nr:metallophosphoesterase [Clostridia bacterium]